MVVSIVLRKTFLKKKCKTLSKIVLIKTISSKILILILNSFMENYFKQNVVSKCFQQHFPLNKTKMASFIVTRQFYKVPI